MKVSNVIYRRPIYRGTVIGSSLLMGIYIYLHRPEQVQAFEFLQSCNLSYSRWRLMDVEALPSWFLYNFPDFLWLFSFTTSLLFIWGNKDNNPERHLWLYLPILIAIGSEFAQYLELIVGTFDPLDLLFYLMGFIAARYLYNI